MTTKTSAYGLTTTVSLPYEQAVGRTREALTGEGFGVLTEIDVKATLKQKLGVEFRPYIILGACNPPFAHQVLSHDRDIGLLLPCNVVVYANDDGRTSTVAAIDPIVQLSVADNAQLRPIATEVKQRLQRVLASVSR